jgi:hypothetical protein
VIYKDGIISSFGLYNQSHEGKISGLDAEVVARSEAMEYLAQYFKKTCKADSDLLAADWKKKFHSQGSVIYPDGALKVLLEAKIKDIFPDGEPCK